MKMTMHIDEALLKRVINDYGFDSKPEAVDAALREWDRRMRFNEVGRKGMGMTPEELADAVDPAYDLSALRAAELPAGYGK